MAFFAMLFAFTPVLEAAACVAEGCGYACVEEEAASEQAAHDQQQQDEGGCEERHCICVASHCSHSAVSPAEPASVSLVVSHARVVAGMDERAVPATPIAPERPPRA